MLIFDSAASGVDAESEACNLLLLGYRCCSQLSDGPLAYEMVVAEAVRHQKNANAILLIVGPCFLQSPASAVGHLLTAAYAGFVFRLRHSNAHRW